MFEDSLASHVVSQMIVFAKALLQWKIVMLQLRVFLNLEFEELEFLTDILEIAETALEVPICFICFPDGLWDWLKRAMATATKTLWRFDELPGTGNFSLWSGEFTGVPPRGMLPCAVLMTNQTC